MATDTSILGVIQHYQRSIERSQEDEERLLYCIKKLYKLPVKVEHLQETGIGKTVNSLRKFNGEIGVASKTLVTKWKAMVAAEEEPMEINCQINDEINNASTRKDTSDEDGDDNNVSENVRSSNYTNNTNSTVATKPNSNENYSKPQPPDSSKEKEKQKHSRRSHIEKSNSNRESSKSDHKKREKHHEISEKSEKPSVEVREHKTSYDKAKKHTEKPAEEKETERHKEASHHKSKSHSSSRTKEEPTENTQHASKEKHADVKKDREHSKHSSSSSKNKEKHSHKNSRDDKKSNSSDKIEKQRDKDKSLSKSSHSSDAEKSTPSTERKRHREPAPDLVELKSPNAKIAKVQTASNLADDSIDSSMGANFADVLGMLNMPTKKSKKQQQAVLNTIKSSPLLKSSHKDNKDISSSSSSKMNGYKHALPSSSSKSAYVATRIPDAKPDLLSSSAKLEPLDPSIALELPMISNNYKPMPYNPSVMDCVFKPDPKPAPMVRTLTDAQALSHGISSKTMRTKIYSGVKTGQIHQVPSLFGLCIRVLQKNIDALEYTGGVPFEVLRPVLERASPHQLLIFEEYNPYLMEDSDVLWQLHVQRNYRTEKRQEMESWREMFLRCQENQDRKLSILAESIKQSQKIITAPVRKTQMAFVDSMVKPPRNVVRKQEQYGTKCKPIATPAARVAALSSVIPNATKTGDARLRVAHTVRDRDPAQVSSAGVRPKKAPLMAKTLQFMRGRLKR